MFPLICNYQYNVGNPTSWSATGLIKKQTTTAYAHRIRIGYRQGSLPVYRQVCGKFRTKEKSDCDFTTFLAILFHPLGRSWLFVIELLLTSVNCQYWGDRWPLKVDS